MSLVVPRVIGHRGAAAHAPENTLASFRKARELGARWVEFDVKLTRDGAPIVMHDERLERTTDGRGHVADRTLAEIRELDAGAWFAPEFDGEKVPTLEEVLALCVELDLGINLEIKPCPGREAQTARVALQALREHWPRESPLPLISSFAHGCLEVARELAPDWPRGYLCTRVPKAWRAELERYACVALHTDHRRMRPRHFEALGAAGVPLLLYTVNAPGRAREVLAAGAAAVFSDRPGVILGALG